MAGADPREPIIGEPAAPPLEPRALAAARYIVDVAEDCAAPVASARILPALAYNDADFFEFEKWALFDREWLFVGHVNQVPNPGDHLKLRILDEPVLIVRGKDGMVEVMSAICQHRGHPLFEGLAEPGDPSRCANAKYFICPYHAWTYNLDGSLHSAPSMGETTPLRKLREEIRLPRIKSEIFHGLIFINFDENAAPLAPTLGKMEQEIANFGIENLMPTPMVKTGPFDWNWKIYHENSLEPYHTDFVHKDSHNPAPANLSKFYEFSPGDGQVLTTTDFSPDAGELFDTGGQMQLPPIPNLTDEQRGRLLFISVMPILFLVIEAGSVLVTMSIPRSARQTDLWMFSLFPEEAARMPEFETIFEEQGKMLQAILAEDMITQAALHRGHRSRFSPPGRFSWLEATIPQMNQWLLERYRKALGIVEEARS
jgi:phenylpropionate dioxygenase-like ring-hydroxylating dioxygenase large terminal subunit